MMTVNLHWSERHSPPAPGVEGPFRWATYNTLHEALEQAVAEDNLTPTSITNAEDGALLADKARIAEYAAAKADLEAKHAAKLANAHEAHLKALANAAG